MLNIFITSVLYGTSTYGFQNIERTSRKSDSRKLAEFDLDAVDDFDMDELELPKIEKNLLDTDLIMDSPVRVSEKPAVSTRGQLKIPGVETTPARSNLTHRKNLNRAPQMRKTKAERKHSSRAHKDARRDMREPAKMRNVAKPKSKASIDTKRKISPSLSDAEPNEKDLEPITEAKKPIKLIPLKILSKEFQWLDLKKPKKLVNVGTAQKFSYKQRYSNDSKIPKVTKDMIKQVSANKKVVQSLNSNPKIMILLFNHYRCLAGLDPINQEVVYDHELSMRPEIIDFYNNETTNKPCGHTLVKNVPSLNDSVVFSHSFKTPELDTMRGLLQWIHDTTVQKVAEPINKVITHRTAVALGCRKAYCYNDVQNIFVELNICAIKLGKIEKPQPAKKIDFSRTMECNKYYNIQPFLSSISSSQ